MSKLRTLAAVNRRISLTTFRLKGYCYRKQNLSSITILRDRTLSIVCFICRKRLIVTGCALESQSLQSGDTEVRLGRGIFLFRHGDCPCFFLFFLYPE